MGGQPSTYLAYACAALAHFFTLGAGDARAQETDGQLLIAGGIVPLSIMHGKLDYDGSSTTTRTAVQVGPGGQALLAVGYGLGTWVLALEASVTYAVTHDERRIESSYDFGEENVTTKQTDITLGPDARYLFIEGVVRPFVELGAGAGLNLRYSGDMKEGGTTLYVRGGPGLQVRLADDVSFDVALRLGYAATSGENDYQRYSLMQSGDGSVTFEAERLEYSIQRVSADLVARLSVWL